MATYLCMRVNNSVKSYTAKTSSEVGKTYLRIPGGYFPLTTDTGTGLKIRSAGSNYRIVETYTTTISVNTSSTNTYTYESTVQSTHSDNYTRTLNFYTDNLYLAVEGGGYNCTYSASIVHNFESDYLIGTQGLFFNLSIKLNAAQTSSSSTVTSINISSESSYLLTLKQQIRNNAAQYQYNAIYMSMPDNYKTFDYIEPIQIINSTQKSQEIVKTMVTQFSVSSQYIANRQIGNTGQMTAQTKQNSQTIIGQTCSLSSNMYYSYNHSYTKNDKTSTSYYTTESTVTSQ